MTLPKTDPHDFIRDASPLPHCLHSEATLSGTEAGESSGKTGDFLPMSDDNIQTYKRHKAGLWLESYKPFEMHGEFHFLIISVLLEYEFRRVCICACVHVCACVCPWVCLESKRWIKFQTEITPLLSKIECTRSACFKVKTTPRWFTLRDEYKKFCEFPMGLLTHIVNTFLRSTNKRPHNWLCEPCVWIRCTILNSVFYKTGLKAGKLIAGVPNRRKGRAKPWGGQQVAAKRYQKVGLFGWVVNKAWPSIRSAWGLIRIIPSPHQTKWIRSFGGGTQCSGS